MLTLIKREKPSRKARYRCECGNEVVAFVSNVNRGHTSSCGCLRRATTSARLVTHGQRSGELYKGKRPRAYAAWVNMRQRCGNPRSPDFKNYGGRGITHCEEWSSFESF